MKRHDDMEDDGRTIFDMSSLPERNSLWLPRRSRREEAEQEPIRDPEESFLFQERPQEQDLSPEERRIYIFAALKASLMIAAVFIIGLGLGILALIALWT